MNKKQLKFIQDSNEIYIIGSAGSGKTVLERIINSNNTHMTYDDFDLRLSAKYQRRFFGDLKALRHTGKKFIIVLHYLPRESVFDFDLNTKKIIIFTSFERISLMRLGTTSLAFRKFRKSWLRSIVFKTKNRPCLVITNFDDFVTRYKFVRGKKQ